MRFEPLTWESPATWCLLAILIVLLAWTCWITRKSRKKDETRPIVLSSERIPGTDHEYKTPHPPGDEVFTRLATAPLKRATERMHEQATVQDPAKIAALNEVLAREHQNWPWGQND